MLETNRGRDLVKGGTRRNLWPTPGGRALAHKVARLGFYWPTMIADAKEFVRKCERYQKHAPIVRQPPELLTSINSPIPFAMWGMDILWPFPWLVEKGST